MKSIVAVLGGDKDKAFSDGIHIAGERYVAFNVEGRHIYGRRQVS